MRAGFTRSHLQPPASGQPLQRCICRGDSLDHLCPVHGNHPSNIVREFEPGDCDNTRGPSSQGEFDGR